MSIRLRPSTKRAQIMRDGSSRCVVLFMGLGFTLGCAADRTAPVGDADHAIRYYCDRVSDARASGCLVREAARHESGSPVCQRVYVLWRQCLVNRSFDLDVPADDLEGTECSFERTMYHIAVCE